MAAPYEAAGAAYLYDLGGATPAKPFLTLTNPIPAPNSGFGTGLAFDGDAVAVLSGFEATSPQPYGRVHVFDVAGATPQLPKVRIDNPRGGPYWPLPMGLDVNGQRLVVGWQSGNPANAFHPGTAYVYDLSTGTPGSPVLILTNAPSLEDDFFGAALAMDGARLIVGAYGDHRGTLYTGSAQVYELGGATPAEPVALLASPSPANNNQFGGRVAVSGTRLLVGSIWEGDSFHGGKIYAYDLAGPDPTTPVLSLTNPVPVHYRGLAYSLALSGSRLVIGSQTAPAGAEQAGMAHVYDLAGASPTVPVLVLTNPGPVPYERFGAAVAFSGAIVVIGTPGEFTNPYRFGAAYVYDVAGASPAVPILTLTNPAPASGDVFGAAVAVDGTRIVIGAHFDDAHAPDAGSAYVYDLSSATPAVPVLALTNPAPANSDFFGSAVAIFGTKVAIGAWGDDTGATSAGSVYVYDVAGGSPAMPTLILTNPQPASFDAFGTAIGLHGSLLVVGAHRDGAGAPQSGSVYVYDLAGASPAVPVASLTNPSPAVADSFGSAVAIDGLRIIVGAPYDDTGAVDRGAAYVFGLRPGLSIVTSSPGLATLSWSPTSSPGFVLQYTDSLAPTNWVNAPSGAMNPVTISTTNAARFYRLAQP